MSKFKKKPHQEVHNSFLQETNYNSDIGEDLRDQIEERFIQSTTNRKYVFPRKSPKLKQKAVGRPKLKQRVSAQTIINLDFSPSKTSFVAKTLVSGRPKKSPTGKFIKSPYMKKMTKVPSLSKGLLASILHAQK